MNFSFLEALDQIGEGAVSRIANEARPAADYLFATLMPERNLFTYHVEGASMTVRSTMAGLVGMDSPYPPGGAIELSSFLERTAKLANEVTLTEEAIRTLQDMLYRLRGTNTSDTGALQREALNFLDKVIIQPHIDVMEWLRGQALVTGKLNWTFNKKNLLVDYGLPASNFVANRTGTNHYGGTTSTFWADIQAARRMLRSGVRGIIGHPDTIDMIQFNPVHAMATVGEDSNTVTFQRWINTNNAAVAGILSADARDRVSLISYDREGEILNPADMSTTLRIPFMPRGRLLCIGNAASNGYVVGSGATDDPTDGTELGYTHIGPTVENGGATGRWAELYVPERAPWSLHGRGVTNGLPIITATDKIVVLSTDMA